jgi:hypothetical protein
MAGGAGQQPAAIGLDAGHIGVNSGLHQALPWLGLQGDRGLCGVVGLQVDRDHLQCSALKHALSMGF